MNSRTKYPPKLRERAIRMVYEQREHHESQWATIEPVAQKIGCTAQTLKNWIAKAEVKADANGAATAPRVRELEREVRELRRANPGEPIVRSMGPRRSGEQCIGKVPLWPAARWSA